jgi:RNA polymerase sigma-70 factor (ECF subfamily)
MIEPLSAELSSYRWFHAARGEFLMELGMATQAREAFAQAMAHGATPAEARHLTEKIALCEKKF